jgi:hypothetical protein
MTILTAGLAASAALMLGLAIGGWAGWRGRGLRDRSQVKDVFPAAEANAGVSSAENGVDDPCLWDPHSSLNALNRCIMSMPQPLAEDHELYLVSDHLRVLAQIDRYGGWVSPGRLQEWLEVLMALRQSVQPAGEAPTCSIVLPEAVQELQMRPLGKALLPLLRQAGLVGGIVIEAGELSHASAGSQAARVVLRLRVFTGHAASACPPDAQVRTSRERAVQVSCEVQTIPRVKVTGSLPAR